MTFLPYKVLTVLFFISRRQFLPSHGNLEDVVSPTHHVLDVETVLPWLQIKSAPCFDVQSYKHVKRHYHHSKVEPVSSWTGSIQNISAYITSRDSTSSRTGTERLSVSRKHETLGNAALRENYRYNGAFTEREEHVESTETVGLETVGSGVSHLCWEVDCGRTLRTSTEWICRKVEEWWRIRLKPSKVLAPVGFIFVADFNTLML